ncbi:hypothetical protein PybrP1_010249 [[Pythium] brassicae (nom. inval.)]|nr:hypothetical protein PybrP1_010249 [[Pythium] brassicae (nom. inval.)]
MLVLSPFDHATGAQLAGAVAAVALTSTLVAVVRVVRRKMRVMKGLAPIPGPAGERLMVQYGGRIKIPASILTDGQIMLASAEDVQHILSTKFENYIKSDTMMDAFRTLFGNSFLCVNHAHSADGGAMWRLQRKVASRVFTTSNFKVFTQELFLKYAHEMMDVVAAQGGRCNMSDISTHYTLRTIFDITCGVSVKEVDAALGLSFMHCMTYAVNNIVDRLIKRPYYRYLWWCMPSEYRLRRDVRVVQDVADWVLRPRLAESDEALAKRSDILSLFIRKARELEGGEGATVLDAKTLRDVFVTFIVTGWDSTASFITYLSYVLAQYPHVQQKVYDEVRGLESISYDDNGEQVADRPYKMATILLMDGGLPLQMTPREAGATARAG